MTYLSSVVIAMVVGGMVMMPSLYAARQGELEVPDQGSWVELDAGGLFTVLVPPGFAYVRQQGIDSQVGRIDGLGIRMGFDYGMYSNPLSPTRSNQGDYSREDLDVAGQGGRLVSWRMLDEGIRWFIVGAYVPSDGARNRAALSIVSSVPTQAEADLVKRILRTLKVPE